MPATSSEEAAEPTEAAPSERLLVVDADATLAGQLAAFARGRLVEVVAASSADEAQSLCRFQRPDAALVSMALPGALDLARALATADEPVPLAFVGASGSFSERVAAARAGALLCLTPPVDEAAFASALQDLFAARSAKSKVLVVTDDPAYAQATLARLADAALLGATTHDVEGLVDQLEKLRPELVLVDRALDEADALDVCRLVRTTPPFRDLPIVLAAPSVDRDARLAGLRAGADDVIDRQVDAEELVGHLAVRLARARQVRERAEKDALTGIATRRAFVELATLRLSEARRHGRPLSFALVDLDHFKAVNDDHGHLAGDQVLATFGRLVATRFRATDLRGRWGGEELALAFPDEAAATAEAVLERLLAEAHSLRFAGRDGREFAISFSAGVAAAPVDGSTLEELVRAADRRLYAAKAAGRSRIRSRD